MNAKRRGARRGDRATVELHFLWNSSLVSGAALAALNATGLGSLSTRFLSIADAYVYFRYKSFRFRVLPANNTGVQAAGFAPVVDVSPASVAQVVELISSVPIDPAATVPTEWISVRKEDLSGPFPWYKTIDGTPDSTEEYPGRFAVQGVNTDAFCIEFRVVVELKEGVATANTPDELAIVRARREQRLRVAQIREREDILRALAPTVTGAIPAAALAPLGSGSVPTSLARN